MTLFSGNVEFQRVTKAIRDLYDNSECLLELVNLLQLTLGLGHSPTPHLQVKITANLLEGTLICQ